MEKIIKESGYSDEKKEKLKQEVAKALFPQPFSKALAKYRKSIVKLLPKDKFLYVFDLKRIKTDHGIKKPEKFMERYIVPEAESNHKNLLDSLTSMDKIFKKVKKEFTANFYIIDIDIDSIIVKAEKKNIPDGMKEIILQDIFQNGDVTSLISDKNIFIKAIIEEMDYGSILSIAETSEEIIEYFINNRVAINKTFKKNKIGFKTLGDKAKLNKGITSNTNSIYGIQNERDYKKTRLAKAKVKEALITIAMQSEKIDKLLTEGFKPE